MRTRASLLLAVLLVQVLMITWSSAAAGALHIRDIRHWTAPDHTRVVIECSGPPTYEDFRLDDPARIVLNIRGARFDRQVRALDVGDGLVRRVRVNTLGGGIAQVVLDVDRREEYRVFALPPSAGRPNRLVIDVMRPVSQAQVERRARQIADLKKNRTIIVMIDPGHGGEDPGALGHGGLQEKRVCLGIARALRDDINRRRGFKAFLTRDGDYYVSLRRRTEIAREHHADYFVSIHANASGNKRVRGTEVYFLSLRGASDEGAMDLAQRENAADHVGGVPRESKDDVESILKDLMHNAAMERSSNLADAVLEEVREDSDLRTRGVKQAGFDVLKTAGMPSILVEVAFITHSSEAKLLKNSKFQRGFAARVAEAVVEYAQLEAAHDAPSGD